MTLYEKIHELMDAGYGVKFEPGGDYYKCLKITVFDDVFKTCKLLPEIVLLNYKCNPDELINEVLEYLEGEIKRVKRQ